MQKLTASWPSHTIFLKYLMSDAFLSLNNLGLNKIFLTQITLTSKFETRELIATHLFSGFCILSPINSGSNIKKFLFWLDPRVQTPQGSQHMALCALKALWIFNEELVRLKALVITSVTNKHLNLFHKTFGTKKFFKF